jgi:hypothetical protein
METQLELLSVSQLTIDIQNRIREDESLDRLINLETLLINKVYEN